jgi:hypothetical protein
MIGLGPGLANAVAAYISGMQQRRGLESDDAWRVYNENQRRDQQQWARGITEAQVYAPGWASPMLAGQGMSIPQGERVPMSVFNRFARTPVQQKQDTLLGGQLDYQITPEIMQRWQELFQTGQLAGIAGNNRTIAEANEFTGQPATAARMAGYESARNTALLNSTIAREGLRDEAAEARTSAYPMLTAQNRYNQALAEEGLLPVATDSRLSGYEATGYANRMNMMTSREFMDPNNVSQRALRTRRDAAESQNALDTIERARKNASGQPISYKDPSIWINEVMGPLLASGKPITAAQRQKVTGMLQAAKAKYGWSNQDMAIALQGVNTINPAPQMHQVTVGGQTIMLDDAGYAHFMQQQQQYGLEAMRIRQAGQRLEGTPGAIPEYMEKVGVKIPGVGTVYMTVADAIRNGYMQRGPYAGATDEVDVTKSEQYRKYYDLAKPGGAFSSIPLGKNELGEQRTANDIVYQVARLSGNTDEAKRYARAVWRAGLAKVRAGDLAISGLPQWWANEYRRRALEITPGKQQRGK